MINGVLKVLRKLELLERQQREVEVSLRVTIAKACGLRLLSPHAASDDEYMRLSRW
jgi:hypothetical protein